jgi:glutamate synthase (NADPH) small chain
MGKNTGFLEYKRKTPKKRPVDERLKDYQEIELDLSGKELQEQGARCMDCGIPFCNTGCPLGNIIPDWNDLVYRDRWRDAFDFLHKTNNFPEWTGRVCPAPCETACVLGINEDPVSIKQIEKAISERGWEEGWNQANPPAQRTGKRVAIIGSGPAGLAAADQLNKAGHMVTVFEKDDRIGGLLRYGIPDFKLEKRFIDRRLNLMKEEGVIFAPSVEVGKDVSAAGLRRDFDAIFIAIGAGQPRELPVEGRNLDGVHLAMDFLPLQNKRVAGDHIPEERFISAAGKHVVIIGGGDTGADCLGTSHRQGAVHVTQLELMPEPPPARAPSTPWPLWPMMMRTSTSHEEGGARDFAVSTQKLSGKDGKVTALNAVRVEWVADDSGRMSMREIAGTEFEIKADLILLAMGFVSPVHTGLLDALGVEYDGRGNVKANEKYESTVPGVFVGGDTKRGASLVVWAIWEGREAARNIDQFLMGVPV